MTSSEQTLNCSSVSTSISNCLVSISDSSVAKVLPVSKEFLVLFWQRQRFSMNICSAFITSMLVLEYKLWLQLNKSWFIQVTVIIKTILKSKNCPNTYFLVQIILLCLNYLSHKVKTTMHVFASKSENETLKCCFINNMIYSTLDFTNFFPVNPNFCFASEWKP